MYWYREYVSRVTCARSLSASLGCTDIWHKSIFFVGEFFSISSTFCFQKQDKQKKTGILPIFWTFTRMQNVRIFVFHKYIWKKNIIRKIWTYEHIARDKNNAWKIWKFETQDKNSFDTHNTKYVY